MPALDHDRFLCSVSDDLGINWRKYRRRQSRRGLRARLLALGLADDPQRYRELLLEDAQEQERLLRAMRVTVTRFYRDPQVWLDLERWILPQLASRLATDDGLRVWSAGCAGGEEAYTVSMVWSHLPEVVRQGRALELIGTDIDSSSLERARRARYDEAALRCLPQALRRASFVAAGSGSFELLPGLRSARFDAADLLADAVPAGQHLVLCRYLFLTYYRGERLRRTARRLASALVPGGALVVGARESVPEGVCSLPDGRDGVLDGFERWPSTQGSIWRKGR